MDIPAQLTALHAKIIGRLLEPERVPWKGYFSGWLAMPLTAEQRAAVPAQSQHLWQLGTGLPFSSFPSHSMQAPRWVVACLDAFRAAPAPQAGQPGGDALSKGHGAAPVSQQADHSTWAAYSLGGLGQTGQDHSGAPARPSHLWGSAASPAAGDDPAPGRHASSLGSPPPRPKPPAHTPGLSRPNGPTHLLPCARWTPHAHIHSLQHCGAAGGGAAASAYVGPRPASRPQAGAGHPVGPHEALASQALSRPASGASSGPSYCWSMVR